MSDIPSTGPGGRSTCIAREAIALAALCAVAAGPAATQPSLMEARANHRTQLNAEARPTSPRRPPAAPPAGVARLIKYPTPIGPMNAYVTDDPHDGKRHPAVLWIHGGYGGLGPGLFGHDEPADNDQTATPYVDAGLVVMCPGFRGHDDDPGRMEMFYGEVNDALAAIDALAKLPYVDPARIYVAGHSTGGTMTLLVAEAATRAGAPSRVRAAFSIAGSPDFADTVTRDPDHKDAPYDWRNADENRLRSATNFVAALKTPCWYFDAANSFYAPQAREMAGRAAAANAPFHAYLFAPATHFDQVRPMNQLIASKIVADDGPTCGITFAPDEIAAAFAKVFDGRRERVVALPVQRPTVHVTPFAAQVFRAACGNFGLKPADAVLHVRAEGDGYVVDGVGKRGGADAVVEADGVNVAASDDTLAAIGPFTVEATIQAGGVNFAIARGDHPTLHEPANLRPPS